MVRETRTIAEREISNREQGILNEEVVATETRRQKDNFKILTSLLSGEIFSLRPHKKGVKKIGLKGVKKENSCCYVWFYY